MRDYSYKIWRNKKEWDIIVLVGANIANPDVNIFENTITVLVGQGTDVIKVLTVDKEDDIDIELNKYFSNPDEIYKEEYLSQGKSYECKIISKDFSKVCFMYDILKIGDEYNCYEGEYVVYDIDDSEKITKIYIKLKY